MGGLELALVHEVVPGGVEAGPHLGVVEVVFLVLGRAPPRHPEGWVLDLARGDLGAVAIQATERRFQVEASRGDHKSERLGARGRAQREGIEQFGGLVDVVLVDDDERRVESLLEPSVGTDHPEGASIAVALHFIAVDGADARQVLVGLDHAAHLVEHEASLLSVSGGGNRHGCGIGVVGDEVVDAEGSGKGRLGVLTG